MAVQVTFDTTRSSCSPNMSIGSSSFRVEVLTSHPAIGVVLTEPSGWSSGKVTWTLVVAASSRSLGTRKATTENPPPSAVAGWIVTWAWATPGRDTAAATAAVRPTPTRSAARRAEVWMNM